MTHLLAFALHSMASSNAVTAMSHKQQLWFSITGVFLLIPIPHSLHFLLFLPHNPFCCGSIDMVLLPAYLLSEIWFPDGLLKGMRGEDLCTTCGRILIKVNYGTLSWLMKNLVFVKASNLRQDTKISWLGWGQHCSINLLFSRLQRWHVFWTCHVCVYRMWWWTSSWLCTDAIKYPSLFPFYVWKSRYQRS